MRVLKNPWLLIAIIALTINRVFLESFALVMAFVGGRTEKGRQP